MIRPNGFTLAPAEDAEAPLIKPMKAVPGKHGPVLAQQLTAPSPSGLNPHSPILEGR